MVKKNALTELRRIADMSSVGESIPKALLNGIDTDPRGHAELEDLYYVKKGQNELLGTFVSFVLARSIDYSIRIILSSTTNF